MPNCLTIDAHSACGCWLVCFLIAVRSSAIVDPAFLACSSVCWLYANAMIETFSPLPITVLRTATTPRPSRAFSSFLPKFWCPCLRITFSSLVWVTLLCSYFSPLTLPLQYLFTPDRHSSPVCRLANGASVSAECWLNSLDVLIEWLKGLLPLSFPSW